MSQPVPPAVKPPPDRHIKNTFIGFAVFVLACAAFLVFHLRALDKSLREEVSIYGPAAQTILTNMSNAEVDKLYEGASPKYRRTFSKVQHDQQFRQIASKAGKLKSWRRVNYSSVANHNGTTTTTMYYVGQWENGTGSLTLIFFTPPNSTEPKLLEIHIEIPGFKI